jgi:hypothetical protein
MATQVSETPVIQALRARKSKSQPILSNFTKDSDWAELLKPSQAN